MAQGRYDLEEQRLAALYDYDVLDTEPEETFDRITRLVRLATGSSMARVSFVDQDREWFKSRNGSEAKEGCRSHSFCTHTIESDGPLVVPDTLTDPRFADHPLVACKDGVRFYVGVPLKTPSGFNIGSLCALDTVPREITREQVEAMSDLGRLVVEALELRKLAMTDSLTGALTRRALFLEAEKEIVIARRLGRQLGCIMFDLDHFRSINEKFGHPTGDYILRKVAARCRGELRTTDRLARVGGEEFAIMLPNTTPEGAQVVAEKIRRVLADEPMVFDLQSVVVTGSFGVTTLCPSEDDFRKTLRRADKALYRAKTCRNATVLLLPNDEAATLAKADSRRSAA
jgi:diguanylate cyclase (GGDEF)-like protein